jgi:hypothetical protein
MSFEDYPSLKDCECVCWNCSEGYKGHYDKLSDDNNCAVSMKDIKKFLLDKQKVKDAIEYAKEQYMYNDVPWDVAIKEKLNLE